MALQAGTVSRVIVGGNQFGVAMEFGIHIVNESQLTSSEVATALAEIRDTHITPLVEGFSLDYTATQVAIDPLSDPNAASIAVSASIVGTSTAGIQAQSYLRAELAGIFEGSEKIRRNNLKLPGVVGDEVQNGVIQEDHRIAVTNDLQFLKSAQVYGGANWDWRVVRRVVGPPVTYQTAPIQDIRLIPRVYTLQSRQK